LRSLLSGHEVVAAALPSQLTVQVAEAARAEGLHYFDLTEDVETARAVRAVGEGAQTVFMPQCGLAPGFVSMVAMALVERFDEVEDVHLRVGALPQFPNNALKYNLTWSVEGLVNEYCNPCEALVDGKRVTVPPLEGLEEFSLDGVTYEAFASSGGVGTLCDSLAGRVRNLDYKTVRYPGHRDLMRFLIRDLKLGERRDLFRDVVENAIPITRQDVTLIFVTVVGRKGGLLTQESWAQKIYGDGFEGGLSALQKTTSADVCAMIDLQGQGLLPGVGVVRQEQVKLDDVLDNRFGVVFGE
ncbi:MAG TPA: saccharopine dehydrogenase C-terminal domain-containing protein, partial [Magnetospirillum sp.]|nr:saccharopine dehydrogenase C-terminal domain-containing protein [Magnetospirillum sp.]